MVTVCHFWVFHDSAGSRHLSKRNTGARTFGQPVVRMESVRVLQNYQKLYAASPHHCMGLSVEDHGLVRCQVCTHKRLGDDQRTYPQMLARKFCDQRWLNDSPNQMQTWLQDRVVHSINSTGEHWWVCGHCRLQ